MAALGPIVPVIAPDNNDADDASMASDDDDIPQGRAPSNWTEKRRAQKAIFERWIISSAGQDALKARTKAGCEKEEDDEQQSILSLLAQQQGGTQIIKNPREYQVELFERAKRENTIAVLDTGSGKTLIAVLLLRWIIDNELESRAAGNPSKISFFVVASVTLVYQQFSVLECNLDHKVIRLCGADGVDNYNLARWQKLFRENNVIVCTADILRNCLTHSYVSMKQINLLIFDEAHHAKKDDPYARIIKDFYLPEDVPSRPRIFGMTASPIDGGLDVIQAVNELECLLDCKIATSTDMSLTEAIKRPDESLMRYRALPKIGLETPLLQTLRARYSHIKVFANVLNSATEIAHHLGRWCADTYLLDAFSGENSTRYEADIEKNFNTQSAHQTIPELDKALKEIRDAVEYIQQYRTMTSARVVPTDLSPKVNALLRYLQMHFERPSNHRCIVFVERRYTARLLHRLFQRIMAGHMRTYYLVGSNNGSPGEDSFSFREQVMTLLKFRKGEVNCLFATSVAEEGLDVPDCNLVIRFDICKTMIQYVQSRGRARNQKSKFFHMIEHGNSIHEQKVREVRSQERTMRSHFDRLPEDRKLVGNSDSLEILLEKEKSLRTFSDPVTKAKLTYNNAPGVLAHFVSAVPTESDEPQHPTYVVSARGDKFVAEVVLPGNAPVRSVEGKPHSRKMLAKRAAAFDACLQLWKKQYLNEHFMPIYHKRLPEMRNALLAVDMKKTNQYDMQTKPSVWARQRGVLPQEMWVTIVDFPEKLDKPHQSLALLTRSPMPPFPSFPVFLNSGRRTQVVSAGLHKSLPLSESTLKKFTRFTMRIFEDVFSKKYEEDTAKLSYWIVPAKCTLVGGYEEDGHCDENVQRMDPMDVIDWDSLEETFAHQSHPWTPQTPNDFLKGRFIVDIWDGSRKFYSHGVDPTRNATDPIPEGMAKSKQKEDSGHAVHTETILNYSIRLWKRAREKNEALWLRNQPVMEAEKILLRRNMLAPAEQQDISESTKVYLCPQPLRISTLSPKLAASCFVWPAIIHRFESYLVSIEGCNAVGVVCSPKFALAAFTKDSDNQGEHEQEERVNFQRGMGENYERLEFIGDTFLKTATTISTFILNPNENEFEFHVRRMLMLCNQNLFMTALELKLYTYIRSLAFQRRLWYPEGLKLLAGTGVSKGQPKVMFNEARGHNLGEKTIADVCEALIGAAFVSHDRPGDWKAYHWDNAVLAVTKLVNSPDHKMVKWDDYEATYQKPSYQTADATAVHKDLAEKAGKEHTYHFTYPRLLYSAFLHPSVPYVHEKMPNYQRLEFLGDALLDMASITYLFYKYPDKDPQWLTEHKMAMVSNKFLGALCVNIGFHKHLRHNSGKLEHKVREYATEFTEAKRVAGDSRDYWTTVSDPPKCLPDIVESYVGAMFIDSGFDYNQVQRFFDEHVKWYFEDMRIYDSFANNHPCTHLHNMLQSSLGCVDYRLMAKELPSVDGMERKAVIAVVMIHDQIIAHSSGKSGRYARLKVAKKALEKLNGLAPFEYRAEFGCNCKIEDETNESGGGQGADCSV